MTALLQVDDLRTHIQLKEGVVHAVDGVTFHVDEGETLGVVGESGCGKTMTALSIMNLLPVGGHIVGGSITLGGRTISDLDDEAMRDVRGVATSSGPWRQQTQTTGSVTTSRTTGVVPQAGQFAASSSSVPHAACLKRRPFWTRL